MLNGDDTPLMSPTLFDRLDKLALETDAQIVLSTHWRKSKNMVDMLTHTFGSEGKAKLDERIVGATPSLCRAVECRAKEIWTWLQEHPSFKGNWVGTLELGCSDCSDVRTAGVGEMTSWGTSIGIGRWTRHFCGSLFHLKKVL